MEVELPDPVRGRLLTLAADLLGRLDADAVPPPLRAIARFTPTKRRRLGTAAIAAALARDDFRASLLELQRQDDEVLVETVEKGDLEPVEDVLLAAAVACLARPDGWPDLVAAAAGRWAGQQAGPDRHAELAAVRAEVAELRAAQRSEPARTRAAVAAAVAVAEEQVAALRRELRERTREARSAERRRAELEDEREELARRQEAVRSGQDAELRRLRTRVQDLERAAEAARRESRSGRDLDDARLWLLTETLVQAAGGLRRELSLAPPTVAPADTVAAGSSSDVGRRIVDDRAAVERVLALPHLHMIVDGYNVTLGGWGGSTLADQRSRLISALAAVSARADIEVTIAFDGATRPAVQPPTPRGIRVLFSQDEIADDLIRRLVAAEPPGRPLLVVTSDQAIVRDVTRQGAWTAPSRALVDLLG